MSDISSELILLFILGAIIFFLTRRPRATKPQRAPDVPPPAPVVERPPVQWDWVVPDAAPAAPAISAPVASTVRPDVVAVRRRARFSRQALIGNRHKLQDAVAIAAIVGPCRAEVPYDFRQ